MVGVLLELDRLADGSTRAYRRRTDLQALVRRVVEESPDMTGRNVHVHAEKVVVAVDPTMTEQMVETLLTNASERTSPGSPVWVSVSSDPEGAIIAVDDTGPEVPEGLRKALASSPDEEKRGAGRGRVPTSLIVLQRLAEVHAGRAWIQEREGGGASFRVFLPEMADVQGAPGQGAEDAGEPVTI
jgi:signal transduction histidine kinase